MPPYLMLDASVADLLRLNSSLFHRLQRKLISFCEFAIVKPYFSPRFNPDTLIKNISALSASLLLYFYFIFLQFNK